MAEQNKPARTRNETLVTGIVGTKLTTVERPVPISDPPPLPVNSELKVIGKRVPRVDGRLKVTGGAKYTADVHLPGMLYARMVTSAHPHARIAAIDTSAAEAYPGVRAVYVADAIAKPSADKPAVARYAGQPLAAIAAITQQIADDASRLVKITYEPLPFVVDLEAARKDGAPLVFEPQPAAANDEPPRVPQKGNVRGPVRKGPRGRPPGEVVKAFAAADAAIEATFRTQVQTHATMETHGVVADWQRDGLTVYASTQSVIPFRNGLADVFKLPKARVRVVTEFMGGGFGSKLGIGQYAVLAANLSRQSGLPVRLMLDRKEEQRCTGNRPSSVQRLRLAADREGRLTAIHLEMYGTGGVGGGAGGAGPAQNMYDCPNVLTEESDVFTHAGPAAAMRAPGHPQGCFALEQSIDMLAEKLGMDPLALREINDSNAARREERKIGAAMIGWTERHKPGADKGPVKRGIGVAQSIWYRFINLDSACEVRLDRDGSVELLSAVQDIGSGIRTVLAQVVAEEFGLTPEDVIVRIGDSTFPIGPSSGGSITTGSITPPARNAAYAVKMQLFEKVAPSIGVTASDLEIRDGRVVVKGDPSKGLPFREAAALIGVDQITARANRTEDYGAEPYRGRSGMGVEVYGGVQFAQIAVDTETGQVKVERVVAVHDCARPMNPLTAENQISGGIIQGVSWALYEDRTLDDDTGLMVNPNLESYKIAGSREVPQIDIRLIEQYIGRSSTDAGGIGEPATIATAAAVANAFYNATGVRMMEIPMTPARVLTALRSANSGRLS